MIRNPNWMATASGGIFHLKDPQAAEVSLFDIAEGLSKLNRFNGQTPVFYSVAQHSCVVMDLLPREAKPYGLFHDAHEAYTGDMTRPVAALLKEKFGCNVLSGLKKTLDAVIYEAFGIEYPMHPNIKRLVEEADMCALATEKRDILAAHDWDWGTVPGGAKLPPAAKNAIRPWGPQLAREKFLSAHERLCVLNPKMAEAYEFQIRERRHACQ